MGQALETLHRPLGALTLVALLAGCAAPVQRQYQTSVSSLASEECRAMAFRTAAAEGQGYR
jgi:hypothetical protein